MKRKYYYDFILRHHGSQGACVTFLRVEFSFKKREIVPNQFDDKKSTIKYEYVINIWINTMIRTNQD